VTGVKYVIAADKEFGGRGFVRPDAITPTQVATRFQETQDEDGVFVAKARRENHAVADVELLHDGGYGSFVGL
jgi:hypothetical protein